MTRRPFFYVHYSPLIGVKELCFLYKNSWKLLVGHAKVTGE